ncbi:MAG: hypothetical protein U5J95_07095 [Balneolaceae bacterium]|nr:hypothetical protein [Balneolaceae bacterium]
MSTLRGTASGMSLISSPMPGKKGCTGGSSLPRPGIMGISIFMGGMRQLALPSAVSVFI